MHYQWDFPFLLRYAPLFWKGVWVTLAYTAGTIFLGLILGLLVGLGRLIPEKPTSLSTIPLRLWVISRNFWLMPLRWWLIAFVEVFRCTPLLVQIVWVYYALPVLLGLQIPATVAAVLTLSCYTAAFYAEIFRGGIVSIERGQWDAARALGLRSWSMMRRVILPQAIRR